MGNWSFVIFLLIGLVWRVVQKAIENAEERKNEEGRRAAQLAQQRGSAGGSGGGSRQSPEISVLTAAPAGESRKERMSSLAARRKAQLEELRQRRSGGKVIRTYSPGQPQAGGASGSSVGTGQGMRRPTSVTAPVPTPTAHSGSMTPGQLHQLGHQQDQTRRAVKSQRRKQQAAEAQTRRREALQQEHSQRARAAEKKRQQAKLNEAKKARRQKAAEQTGAYSRPSGAGRTDSPSLRGVRAGLRDRKRIREAFILKELLDLPVSLRPGN